ncbi:hypothetical protein EON80_04150 [bacterium]|nr:MAG: hypothetical protein EON80_04150 [bacterium]
MNKSIPINTSSHLPALSVQAGRGAVITDGVLGAINANRFASRGGFLGSAVQSSASAQNLSRASILPAANIPSTRTWIEAAQAAVRAAVPTTTFEAGRDSTG